MFFRRLLVASFLLIFTATAASAYTVVMRNGRRVEIPNTFTLTDSTLTYETAPGIQVTIQTASIDVAATETANRQAPGAFRSQVAKPAETATPVQTQRTPATRSITNKDLEVYRRARLESERERQQLGLPSAEERQREVAEIDDRTQEQIRNMRSREELDFWRNRALALESQNAMTATQLNAANNQVNDYPWAYPYGIGLVTSGFPFGVVDGFNGFNRFNKFGFNNNFGFNGFGFNRFGFNGRFPGQFRGRLLFTPPAGPRGGFSAPRPSGFHGGGGGGRGGRR